MVTNPTKKITSKIKKKPHDFQLNNRQFRTTVIVCTSNDCGGHRLRSAEPDPRARTTHNYTGTTPNDNWYHRTPSTTPSDHHDPRPGLGSDRHAWKFARSTLRMWLISNDCSDGWGVVFDNWCWMISIWMRESSRMMLEVNVANVSCVVRWLIFRSLFGQFWFCAWVILMTIDIIVCLWIVMILLYIRIRMSKSCWMWKYSKIIDDQCCDDFMNLSKIVSY